MGAIGNRWPTIHSSIEYAEAGGVIAYGADYAENARSSAVFVDRIFKGAKPAKDYRCAASVINLSP
jgi:putative tryptophan/tyrosine transport system substrate-binding protein